MRMSDERFIREERVPPASDNERLSKSDNERLSKSDNERLSKSDNERLSKNVRRA